MIVFAAFYGEYEMPHPIGIYNTLEKAKKAVEDTKPSYNTEVIEYDVFSGKAVAMYHCSAGHYSDKLRVFTWTNREEVI